MYFCTSETITLPVHIMLPPSLLKDKTRKVPGFGCHGKKATSPPAGPRHPAELRPPGQGPPPRPPAAAAAPARPRLHAGAPLRLRAASSISRPASSISSSDAWGSTLGAATATSPSALPSSSPTCTSGSSTPAAPSAAPGAPSPPKTPPIASLRWRRLPAGPAHSWAPLWLLLALPSLEEATTALTAACGDRGQGLLHENPTRRIPPGLRPKGQGLLPLKIPNQSLISISL